MTDNASFFKFKAEGSSNNGLKEWETMDPNNLISGNPIQRGHVYHENPNIGYMTGVWDCTEFVDQMGPYPVDEFMLFLDSNPKSKKYKKIVEEYYEVYNKLKKLGWSKNKIKKELNNKVEKKLKDRGAHITLAKKRPKNKKMVLYFEKRKYVKSGDAKFFQGGSPGLGKRK